jgi:hypothetical protein
MFLVALLEHEQFVKHGMWALGLDAAMLIRQSVTSAYCSLLDENHSAPLM